MDETFFQLLANLEPGYREETLEGRPHWVVPCTMLGESVIETQGDVKLIPGEGGILYPNEAIAADPQGWNGMPLVAYHPKVAGKYVSARQAAFLNHRKMGQILNTTFSDLLRTEAWFDTERTRLIDRRVYDAIKARRRVETSTGVLLALEARAGEHGGKKYRAVVKAMRPDHLATLVDRKGAYSIDMGGGLWGNEAGYGVTEAVAQELALLANGEPSEISMPDGSFVVSNEADLKDAIRAAPRARNPHTVRLHIRARAAALGLQALIPDEWVVYGNEGLAALEMSFGQTSQQLRQALAAKHGDPGESWPGYVEEVFPDFVIYQTAGSLYKDSYTTSDNGVKLAGKPVKVSRTVAYTANESDPENKTPVETQQMALDVKAHVTALIGCNDFEEADRPKLEALDPAVLVKIKPTVKPTPPPTPVVTPAVNEAKPITMADLPPAVRQKIERMEAQEKAQKDALVNELAANENCPFEKAFLEKKDVEELAGLARMARGANVAAEDSNGGMFRPGMNPQAPLWVGAAGAAPYVNSAPPLDEPLVFKDTFSTVAAAK